MFISKQEKVGILSRISTLEAMVKSLYETQRLKREKSLEASKKYYASKTRPPKKGWTPEAKAIQSERMKLMWSTRKALKDAK